jgi:hypothetical protein
VPLRRPPVEARSPWQADICTEEQP